MLVMHLSEIVVIVITLKSGLLLLILYQILLTNQSQDLKTKQSVMHIKSY